MYHYCVISIHPTMLLKSPSRLKSALRRPLELDDPSPDSNGNRLRAGAGAQFLHDVLDVNLDRLFGDVKARRDVAIPVATRDVAQNVDFTRGQGFVAQMLGQIAGHFGGHTLLSRVDLANHVQQFTGRHALEHITTGARLHGALDFHVALESGEHDDTSVREFRADANHDVDTADVGKPQVHQRNVGPMLAKLPK